MKVSVVIPVFNRISTLKDALESIFRQTYKKIEIIVIDDGSDIDLYKYLKPYLPKIFYIKKDKNTGVSDARNIGIKASNGEFIAFLDSDDIWLDFKIDYQLKSMEKQNIFVSHTNEFWYKNGKFINQGKKHKKYGGKILTNILDICRISPSSILMHKSVFTKVGLFNPYMKACEDYDLWLRIALFYEVLYLQEKTLVKRSITNDQLSLNTPYMESMRLKSLLSFLNKYSNYMNYEEKIHTLKEIKRKFKIVSQYTK